MPEPPWVARASATPTVPRTVVIVNGDCALLIAKVTVAVAAPELEPVPVIVTVAVEAEVGVPEITPVEVLSDNPAGSVPVVTA